MHVLLARRFIAKPLLAAALVGVSTWAGASPAGVPPHHESVEVAFADLPIPIASTTTTTAAPTTTTLAPAPPTTAAPAPRPAARPPATTATTRRPSGPAADPPVP